MTDSNRCIGVIWARRTSGRNESRVRVYDFALEGPSFDHYLTLTSSVLVPFPPIPETAP